MNTRISMDDEYDEEREEEKDIIRGKLENNIRWLADNENCHSPECDRDRAYHEARINELEDRREQIGREEEQSRRRRRRYE